VQQALRCAAIERLRRTQRAVAVDPLPGADHRFAQIDARKAGAQQRFAGQAAAIEGAAQFSQR